MTTLLKRSLFTPSDVVMPGEVGILLIYVPNIFLSVLAKDERSVS